jgi:chemotaxis methyl-accepting protein methylase
MIAAFVRLNRSMWTRLPPAAIRSRAARAYGRLLHRLVRRRAVRRSYFGTYFFRNRPALALVRRLADRHTPGATLRIAFLGCSNGAEVYSILWTVRSARPDLRVEAHAVDISAEILEAAHKGVYARRAWTPVDAPIFAHMTDDEMQAMFDIDEQRDEATINTWLREGIRWHLGDAGSPAIVDALGLHDMVLANNFLCHMDPPTAERCLRNIARLVAPGGHLIVSGIDLDVRTSVARALRWTPVPELMDDIHDGDATVRNDWPWHYWGLEPLDKQRRDWSLRYASAFQVGAPIVGGGRPSR